MNNQMLIVAIVAVIAVALATWWYLQRRRHEHLRTHFGPEYDRAVRETGSAAKADAVLAARERRVEKLHIRPLSPEESTRFSGAWRAVQSRFVDDPKGAVIEADKLITDVMSTRGYPMATWEQRVADVSVDYPRVCERYRVGHDIALRQERGSTSTEDLRQAMMAYRDLFAELVEPIHEPIREQQRRAG